MATWRFIKDRPRTGAENMALDEALALSSRASSLSTLRVYSFDPPCITIGRFQSLEGFVDIDRCRSMGTEVARRPTGGLAILHSRDVTYSFTCPIDACAAATRDEYFRYVAVGIVEALRLLGIDALITSHTEKRDEPRWCFAREFGIDIEWHDMKICGSSQRISGGALLQHGSLFLEDNTRLASELAGGLTQDGVPRAPVSLSEASGRQVGFDEVAEALEQGFSSEHGVDIQEGELTTAELEQADRLLRAKYTDDAWIMGDSASSVCDIIVQNNSAGDDYGR